MTELEDQLCTFSPGASSSPDRLDAAVYALTELMCGGGNDGMIEYMAREVAAMHAPPRPAADRRTVRMIAPPSSGTLMTITGRTLQVPGDRILYLDRDEADALRAVPGWIEYLESPADD